jgi:hypothetical protein
VNTLARVNGATAALISGPIMIIYLTRRRRGGTL